MSTIHFHQLLRKKVQEAIDAECDRIVDGYNDFYMYREQVGYLRGMKTVLDIAEEIEKGMT